VSDGCGNTLECGTCSGHETCGGAGVANVCGATCLMSCPESFTCNSSGVCAGGDLSTLAFDLKPVPVSGSITLNGAPVLDTTCSYEYWGEYSYVRLTETTRGGTKTLPVTCSATEGWTFSGQLYPGTYKVEFDARDASSVPGTPFVVLPSLDLATGRADVVLNVRTVNVAGTLTRNGTPLTSATCPAYAPGSVRFTETTRGFTLAVPARCSDTEGWIFSGAVLPGTYRVAVAAQESSALSAVPYPILESLSLEADRTGLVLDIPSVEVSGSILRNGAPLLDYNCNYNSGGSPALVDSSEVDFVETTKGFRISVPVSCTPETGWTFRGPIYAGTYRVEVVARQDLDPTLPVSLPPAPYPALTSVTVLASQSGMVLDVPTVRVSGTITQNGAPLADTSCLGRNSYGFYDLSFVSLVDATTNRTVNVPIACSETAGWSFDGLTHPGMYTAKVAARLGASLPQQPYTALSSLDARADRANIALDVRVVDVSGSITRGGASIPGANCSISIGFGYYVHSNVLLTDAAQGYSFLVPITCTEEAGWTFSGRVYAGNYRVDVLAQEGSTLPSSLRTVIPSVALQANRSDLVLDVRTQNVAGHILRNGAPIADTTCTYFFYWFAYYSVVQFTDLETGATARVRVSCSVEDGWSFSGPVYPGTYRVDVLPHENSSQPPGPLTLIPRLRVP
jgi:hypothetical protein